MNYESRQPGEEHKFEILKYSPLPTAIFVSEDIIIEFANKAILAIWKEDQSVVGMPLQEAFPQLKGQSLIGILKNVWKTGTSYTALNNPATFKIDVERGGFFYNYTYKALKNNKGQVYAIMNTVTTNWERQSDPDQIDSASEQSLQMMNDELSSAVEELVAANEEQISINDELAITQDHLQDTIKELASSESRFRFMLNAIPQQVWTADPNGALDYVNQVVCDDFGHTMEEIVGNGWHKFIHPEDLVQCSKKWTHSLKTGKPYMVEFRLLFNDGTYRWHLGRAIPYNENGNAKLWLGTNTDIEIQKENEVKKDEFLSIASHELKTPLTSIKAFNQLLQRVKEPESIANFVQKSSEHIARLERLISDLLDVTKINSGRMQYNMKPFNFGEMIRNSISVFRHTVPNHEIILKNEIEQEYTGDQFRLEMVINNFISNAVKYSPDCKKILIESKVKEENIVVSVQDFGIGIDQPNLDKLFDRSYRVDNSAMLCEGLGLGLFISSEILKRHKGSFWVESKLGEGSTFYFGLPLNSEATAV